MPNTRAVELLQTFAKNEWLSFRQYLIGKKGEQNQLLAIFDHLHSFNNDLDSPELQLIPSYEKLRLPKQTLKDFQNQTYRLRDLLEEFLVVQKLLNKGATFQKEKLLLEVLKERGLESAFFKQIKKTRKKIRSQPKNRWNHLQQLELHDLEYFHVSTPKISKSNNVIESAMKELDLFWKALKIRYGAELLSRNQILDEENDVSEVERLIEQMTLANEITPEYHSLFSNVCKLILNGKEASYFSLKSQFEKDHEKISVSERRAVHGYLVNHCIQQIQKNNLQYVEEITALYDMGFKHKILLDENSLSSTRFCNLIDLLAKNKEFERAQQFINDHSGSLQSDVQEESTAIANSIIFFEKGEYGQVMKTLSLLKSFSHPANNLRSRWLQLCSLFEEKEFLSLDSYIKGTKEFLRRNKHLGEKHKKGTLNLIKIIECLKVPKFDNKRKTKEVLSSNLEQMDFIYFKAWILKKIKEH